MIRHAAAALMFVVPTAAPSSWLLPLLLVSVGFSSASFALLLILLIRRGSAPKPDKDEKVQIRNEASEAAASLQVLGGQLKKATAEISEQIHAVNLLRVEHLASVTSEIGALRQEISGFGRTLEAVSTRPTAPEAIDPVALEHRVLGESWKQFRENKELSASFDAAAQDVSWEPLLAELAPLVPEELRPTFDAVVGPCRAHRKFISRISLVPRLVNGEIRRLEADGEEVRRTREFAALLNLVQNPADSSKLLSFHVKSWVTDSFLSFADLYLQRYQQAQLENRHGELQSGVNLVLQVLRIAAVEPIDIAPGETSFDSTRHIGRSTTNDPRFADGVITGVVRNGFIEAGRQVIRQPEVIVNRTR